jgi:hypothetical protein
MGLESTFFALFFIFILFLKKGRPPNLNPERQNLLLKEIENVNEKGLTISPATLTKIVHFY